MWQHAMPNEELPALADGSENKQQSCVVVAATQHKLFGLTTFWDIEDKQRDKHLNNIYLYFISESQD